MWKNMDNTVSNCMQKDQNSFQSYKGLKCIDILFIGTINLSCIAQIPLYNIAFIIKPNRTI